MRHAIEYFEPMHNWEGKGRKANYSKWRRTCRKVSLVHVLMGTFNIYTDTCVWSMILN